MIVGNVAVVDQCRAIVVDARLYPGGCLVVGVRLARADPAAQPVWLQRAPRQWRQQQAEETREDQDDPCDVQVQPVRGACRQGEPQDRAGGDEEDARAGTHPAPSAWRRLAGLPGLAPLTG